MGKESSDNRFRHLIEPFSYNGDKAGCLLLHGFTASPSELKPLGTLLSEQGYAVHCPLLPGHGTSIDDLDRYRWQDWYNIAAADLKKLREQHEKCFVIGLSMGGALALQLAAEHSVEGVVALASGVKLRDWRVTMLPLLHHFRITVKKTRNAFARGPDRLRFAYDYNSSKSSWQIVLFYRHLTGRLGDVTAPLLLINSKHDRTIPYENVEIISSKVRSEIKKTVSLESNDHIITLGQDKDTVNGEVLNFLTSLS